jgi:lipoic acid synthetase
VESGRPEAADLSEPLRVAEATREMKLRHVVITSVTRDDLEDGGARLWAETVREVRRLNVGASIEVLIPDFKGDEACLEMVFESRPDILNHNVETVPSLYSEVRPQAVYERSVEVLRRAKARSLVTKTGLMLGMGEEEFEVESSLSELREAGVDVLTLGQYLSPSRAHYAVRRWVTPEEFVLWKKRGLAMGFRVVESGPLVRSSYHADEAASVMSGE